MSASAANQPPTPVRIFQMLNAFQQTEALRAAIDLDVFTQLGDDSLNASALAKRIGAATKGARVLCDYLAIAGLLNKDKDKYSLTPEAQMFLSKKSPAYIGSATQFMCSDYHLRNFSQLADAVRRGGSAIEDSSTSPENPMWVNFARGMAPLRVPAAEFIAKLVGADQQKPMRVLDIAASHGLFGITIAKHNPKAEIVAVDWRPVLEVAKENAAKAGVQNRYNTIAGSAFDVDFGSGYDVALVTAFLHHFDVATNETFLRKIHSGLKPGGIVATLEFVPNEDRVTPPHAAGFALIMLSNTASGDAYTFRELEQMFRNAGFGKSELHNNPNSIDQVIITKK